MSDVTSLNGLDKDLDAARIGLIRQIANKPPPTEVPKPTRPSRSSLDRVIADEARCAPAHVKKAREVIRSGREDLIIGMIFSLVSVTAAHRVVKPKPIKPGLREYRRQLLGLLGGGQ